MLPAHAAAFRTASEAKPVTECAMSRGVTPMNAIRAPTITHAISTRTSVAMLKLDISRSRRWAIATKPSGCRGGLPIRSGPPRRKAPPRRVRHRVERGDGCGRRASALHDLNAMTEMAMRRATRPFATALVAASLLLGPAGSARAGLRCPVFPPDNPWNQRVDTLPVHPRSADYVASLGADLHLHADFGSFRGYGIPYNVVHAPVTPAPVRFTVYGDQSGPGPYPIPARPKIEAGSDHHLLVVDDSACKLYELYAAKKTRTGWAAASGAIFDLTSNALRPAGWTSADAAGLPIFPGLVRYDEVAKGAIHHALRFTASRTQRAYILPARHWASDSTDPTLPPMGLRVRLKAGYDTGWIHGQARVVADALKLYGMMVADNGSSWFITGANHPDWNDADLDQLKSVPASAFEAVD